MEYFDYYALVLTYFSPQAAGELIGRDIIKLLKEVVFTTNRDIAGGLVLSRFSKLLNPASVATGVMGLSLADDQRAFALVVGDEESNVGLADLDTILVPLDPRVRIVDLALQLKLLLRDAVLALLQLLAEAKFWIRG